jgi:type IV fimbrial biogenesis protein FimT
MHQKSVKHSGFTLIELIVTVSIAAILLSMAIPSFIGTIASNRLTTNANEFVTALNLARSEAINRGISVTVRKVDNNSFTNLGAGANWEDGWDVFTDNDSDGVFDNLDGDTLIRTYAALKTSYTLRGNNNFVNFIRYRPDGSSNNLGSFITCDNGSITGAKLIIVNAVGRVRMGSDINNNGIPEKVDGTEISSCTVISGF